MGYCEGVRYLYREEIYHSDKLLWNDLSQLTKISILYPIIDIIETLAVFSQLQIQKLVFVYFISIDNMWSLRRYINPRINNAGNLMISWFLGAAIGIDLVWVNHFEDELVVNIWLHAEFRLLDTDETFRRNYIEYL